MSRTRRLVYGAALCFALGCAAATNITPEQRVQLEVLALQQACLALPPGAVVTPEVRVVCAAFASGRADAGAP